MLHVDCSGQESTGQSHPDCVNSEPVRSHALLSFYCNDLNEDITTTKESHHNRLKTCTCGKAGLKRPLPHTLQ